MTPFKEITCSSALNNLHRGFPYRWDLNIYRGCTHGCKYCFAQYSHDYLNSGNYFGEIFVKTNIVEQLEKALRNPRWKRDVINLGGVTDSYQPAEAEYRFMPEILKLLIKYKTPAIISTKSDLILRDYDLIDELSRITYINVAATITTVDERLREKMEPGGCASANRFAMLKAFRQTNASVGLHVMPIVPYLTDAVEHIEDLFANAKESNVHYVLPGVLYLRGKTRNVFFDFIRQDFPEKYHLLKTLYAAGGAGKAYKDQLYVTVNALRAKYQLSSSYAPLIKEKLYQPKENLLFDFSDL
jgi:DNA repair photolyase